MILLRVHQVQIQVADQVEPGGFETIIIVAGFKKYNFQADQYTNDQVNTDQLFFAVEKRFFEEVLNSVHKHSWNYENSGFCLLSGHSGSEYYSIVPF